MLIMFENQNPCEICTKRVHNGPKWRKMGRWTVARGGRRRTVFFLPCFVQFSFLVPHFCYICVLVLLHTKKEVWRRSSRILMFLEKVGACLQAFWCILLLGPPLSCATMFWSLPFVKLHFWFTSFVPFVFSSPFALKKNLEWVTPTFWTWVMWYKIEACAFMLDLLVGHNIVLYFAN